MLIITGGSVGPNLFGNRALLSRNKKLQIIYMRLRFFFELMNDIHQAQLSTGNKDETAPEAELRAKETKGQQANTHKELEGKTQNKIDPFKQVRIGSGDTLITQSGGLGNGISKKNINPGSWRRMRTFSDAQPPFGKLRRNHQPRG